MLRISIVRKKSEITITAIILRICAVHAIALYSADWVERDKKICCFMKGDITMISTNKVIGFYVDAFGNEVDEYEQIEKYSVRYKGKIFEGDTDGYNIHHYDRWEDAKSIYDMYPGVSIYDNEYDIIFEDGDWH